MDSVTEAMMGFVVTLAAASYGHFGVTLRDDPALHHSAVQRTRQPIVRRIPASLAVQPGALPCSGQATVAERAVLIGKA